MTMPNADMSKHNDSRPANRKCHRPNTFGVKMSLLLLNKFMITATEISMFQDFLPYYDDCCIARTR